MSVSRGHLFGGRLPTPNTTKSHYDGYMGPIRSEGKVKESRKRGKDKKVSGEELSQIFSTLFLTLKWLEQDEPEAKYPQELRQRRKTRKAGHCMQTNHVYQLFLKEK